MAKIVFKGVTPAGLASYAWLEKPDNSPMGKGKYKCALRLEKGIKANDDLAKLLNDEHKKAGGKRDKAPVKDGDAMAEDNEKAEGMRGFWVLQAKTKDKPDLRNAAGKKLVGQAPRSGDRVKLAIAAAPYDQDGSRGVTLYLNAVQLLERLSTANSAGDAFGDESETYGNPDEDEAHGFGNEDQGQGGGDEDEGGDY